MLRNSVSGGGCGWGSPEMKKTARLGDSRGFSGVG
jgi:hypothetical protein